MALWTRSRCPSDEWIQGDFAQVSRWIVSYIASPAFADVLLISHILDLDSIS